MPLETRPLVIVRTGRDDRIVDLLEELLGPDIGYDPVLERPLGVWPKLVDLLTRLERLEDRVENHSERLGRTLAEPTHADGFPFTLEERRFSETWAGERFAAVVSRLSNTEAAGSAVPLARAILRDLDEVDAKHREV